MTSTGDDDDVLTPATPRQADPVKIDGASKVIAGLALLACLGIAYAFYELTH